MTGSDEAPLRSTGEGFDARDFRNALGTFATGVTIITTRRKTGELVGLTANSFASVSLSPPLVLWSQSLYGPSHSAFQECSHFVVNILAADQLALSQRFARTHEDKFAAVDHIIPECGAPVILGSAAHFECRNEFRYYGGDHVIFIGGVVAYENSDRRPLVFARGRYMDIAERAEP